MSSMHTSSHHTSSKSDNKAGSSSQHRSHHHQQQRAAGHTTKTTISNNISSSHHHHHHHETIEGGGGVVSSVQFRADQQHQLPRFVGIRGRSDSAGSTRDAFYRGDDTPKNADHVAPTVSQVVTVMSGHGSATSSELRHRKKKKKTSPVRNTKEKVSSSSVADMATLAMQMNDMAPLPGTEPREALKPGAITLTPPRGATTTKQQKTKAKQPQPNFNKEESDDLEYSSEFYFSEQVMRKSQRRSNSSKTSNYGSTSNNSNNNRDSLRYSGHPLEAAAKTSLVQRESSQLLGAAFLQSQHGNNNNELPQLPMSMLEEELVKQDEISRFASMATSDELLRMDDDDAKNNKELPTADDNRSGGDNTVQSHDDSYAGIGSAYFHRLVALFDPTDWLSRDVVYDEYTDEPFFEDHAQYTIAGLVRHFFYNPISPEFTSLQQFVWACMLGVFMGFYTAVWKWFIEWGVDFFWESVPEKLMEWGVFTELGGRFPMYHYMWILPALFGGVLSYVFVRFPTPDQNEWINSVHSRGVQKHETFFHLFFTSTVGMWSGLSLGPELPLVLTGGMVGSYLALMTKQSMLQARVMNLTAASAAVGGFFGFPMAGALFVMEIPHRMGLQYFESLSPGTIASIIAVLVNRLVVGNDVTGYFRYPFLTLTLPSKIFGYAVVYGLYGCFIGICYTHATKFFKTWVHDWFHAPHDHHDAHSSDDHSIKTGPTIDNGGSSETLPLVPKKVRRRHHERPSLWKCLKSYFCFVIPNEGHRAAVAGVVAGALVGVIGIFLPHTMFWGEAQLQNLIDKGRTPLPVFGEGSELTAHAFCMIDSEDEKAIHAGFNVGCAALISIAKTVVVGLSLGTGIIGGHFWGPLFVGCASSHLLTDLVGIVHQRFGIDSGLATYPCLVILCTMGSAHVVTFRAHLSIMLVLTLTISAFKPEDTNSPYTVAGDYSAVFPLLVVSVFVSLMASRDTVFYPTQRSRGDITAVPEVLCQPNREGAPLVVGYDQNSGDEEHSYDENYSSGESREIDVELAKKDGQSSETRSVEQEVTQSDIERAFNEANTPKKETLKEDIFTSGTEKGPPELSSERLDELLGLFPSDESKSSRPRPIPKKPLIPKHRRTQSAPVIDPLEPTPRSLEENRDWGSPAVDTTPVSRSRTNSTGSEKPNLMRVSSFGKIEDHQPSLMEQARMRAASSVKEHRRIPSLPGPNVPRHNRASSMPLAPDGMSVGSRSRPPSSGRNTPVDSNPIGGAVYTAPGGALPLDDIQLSFGSVVQDYIKTESTQRPDTGSNP